MTLTAVIHVQPLSTNSCFICVISSSAILPLAVSLITAACCAVLAAKSGVPGACRDGIEQVARAFPQVSEIVSMSCKRRTSGLDIKLTVGVNTYSVRGDGRSTAVSIENALKRHFGEGTHASVFVKRYSQIPVKRRK